MRASKYPMLNARSGGIPPLPRNRDAVDRPDASLERVLIGRIVKYGFVGGHTGVAGCDRHHARVAVFTSQPERTNLRIVRMRGEDEHRLGEIGSTGEKTKLRCLRSEGDPFPAE